MISVKSKASGNFLTRESTAPNRRPGTETNSNRPGTSVKLASGARSKRKSIRGVASRPLKEYEYYGLSFPPLL